MSSQHYGIGFAAMHSIATFISAAGPNGETLEL
jgi:hypothetical protein